MLTAHGLVQQQIGLRLLTGAVAYQLSSTDVVIPSGGTQPTIGGPGAVCNNITINASATLTMNNTGTLSVNGNWSKAGTFTGNAGSTVDFVGGTQTISGNSGTFRNLTINSTVSTSMDIATNTNGVLSIPAGKLLIVNNVTYTILTGGTSSVSGTLRATGSSGLVTATGALTVNSGGTYHHNINGGTVPTAAWNVNSTCLITGVTNTYPSGPGLNQTFGNFTWNCTGQGAIAGNNYVDNANFAIAGDLTVQSTGSTDFRWLRSVLTVSGDLFLSGGTNSSSRRSNKTLTVNGNATVTGGNLMINGGSVGTLNVIGDFSLSTGTMTMSNSAGVEF